MSSSFLTGTGKTGWMSLFTAYVDNKKAFLYIPPSWLAEVQRKYKIFMIERMVRIMNDYCTDFFLTASEKKPNYIRSVPVKREVSCGKFFSSLWFCAELNPLSTIITHNNSFIFSTVIRSLTDYAAPKESILWANIFIRAYQPHTTSLGIWFL